MSQSYTHRFLKIYFWQTISIFMRFFSLFIVTPFITSNPQVYGVYMVCISVTIFLSYADVGFFSAAQKYVSESVIKKDMKEEVTLLGFVTFVIFLFSLIYLFVLLLLFYNPSLLIKDLASTNYHIASSFFLVLALFTPALILGRIVGIIFVSRLEDYLYQKVSLFFSIMTLCSVFVFFRAGHYDLFQYFFFSQFLTFCATSVCIYIAYQRYHYDFFGFIKSIQYSKKMYQKTKALAFSSFYNSIIWFLYYEIDLIVISKLLGAEAVAYYAPALIFANFFRVFTGGVLFGPFQTRFNYFIGQNDMNGLKIMYLRTVLLTMPAVVLPIISAMMLMKPLILTWIGSNYFQTIFIAQLLLLCFLFHFLTTPSSLVLNAKEKVKELNIVYTILLVVYWGSIFGFIHILQLNVFPIAKFLVFMISAVGYLFLCLKTLHISYKEIYKIIKPIILPVLFLMMGCFFIGTVLPSDKNKIYFLLTISSGAFMCGLSFLVYLFFSKQYRLELKQIKEILFL